MWKFSVLFLDVIQLSVVTIRKEHNILTLGNSYYCVGQKVKILVMYHRFKGVSVAEISSASTNSEICCLGQAVLLQQIPRQCGFVLVLRCYPSRVSLRLPCLACASPASFCCVSGVPLMLWWAGSGEDQSVLWYLVFAWLLKGKKDTSAPAREEVVLMEVALWQQLAVGLQLTSGMKRGRHLNSDKPSLPGGFSSHLLLPIAWLSSLHDSEAVC